MSTMKLAALLNDRDKSRALAGKLAKLAEKRKQEKTRKQEEENMAEASTPTGAAVQEMRKSVLEARGRLREREAAQFEKLLDSVDVNADDSTTEEKQHEYILFKRIQRQLQVDLTEDKRQAGSSEKGKDKQKLRRDPSIREAIVVKDLQERKQSCLELLPNLDDEIELAKEELRREEELLRESKEMKDGVSDRIIEIYSSSGDVSPEQYFRDMRRKIRAKHLEHNDISLELEDTVLAVSPFDDVDGYEEEDPDDVEDIRRYFRPAEKGKKKSRQEEREEFLLLLSDLMQAMNESPVDPYINVAEYYEGVRMRMVESGIAVEHPSDSSRLRLLEFHKTFDDASDEERDEDEEEGTRRELLDYYNAEDDVSDVGEIGEDDMAI